MTVSAFEVAAQPAPPKAPQEPASTGAAPPASAVRPSSTTPIPREARLFLNSKRIVFLGDSITAAGQYVALLDGYLHAMQVENPPVVINCGLPSETVSGLSEEGHAGGKFPRPDVHERLTRVLALTKPDLVVSCYGMNCAIYQPFDVGRFEKYQAGYRKLREAVQAAGAELLVITPPCYDDRRAPKPGFRYNEVLARYAAWLIEQRESGWNVIDLHTPMSEGLAKLQASDPQFTLQPDGVHPNPLGHLQVAEVLTRRLGDHSPRPIPTTAEEYLSGMGFPPRLWPLLQQRMSVRRDAYVATAGHLRPGVAKGLPLEDADRKAAELTREILAITQTVPRNR